jgi:hypothetical protein
MLNSKDLLARLLANENLNVIRANVSTASFDSMSRTLTLPQWKEMTPEVEEMLIGHEVGHALYTTLDYIEEPNFGQLHGYLNIVEDVRIEKKVKAKYPGLRKSFVAGYKALQEKDFFGISGKDLSKLLLIDKINLYYKCGFSCGVKFTAEEMAIVRKVDSCDSMADAWNMAQEIWTYTKTEREEKQKELDMLRKLNGDDMEEIVFESDDDDEDDFDTYLPDDNGDFEREDDEVENSETEASEESDSDKARTSLSSETESSEIDKELQSVTQKQFESRLGELADTDTIIQYFAPKLEMTRNPIVSYKTIVTELKAALPALYTRYYNAYGDSYTNKLKLTLQEETKKFKTDSSRVVNYLVKEFEMRKSATEYRRVTTSKSGELDVRKLYAHTLTNDIFKKLDVLPEDKNHGMVFLLDWSGSMGHVMSDTIKQVINLAMFCQRIQIPYQVFAFASAYESVPHDVRREGLSNVDERFPGFHDSQFHLLELFSNKMSNSEFNTMVDCLLAKPWTYARKYDLHGTPLNESLMYLVDYVGKFIKNNSVEKMSVITLTDGEGHGIDSVSNTRYGSKWNPITRKSTSVKSYIRDPLTKKEYRFESYGSDQTRALLKIIKDRYNAKTIGFHICANSRRDISSFIRANIGGTGSSMNEYMMMEEIRKEMRQNDYALIKNAGRDELYLLPASKQKIVEGDLDIKETMNARAIAKQFSKFLNVKKTSRVVLSRFVGMVA